MGYAKDLDEKLTVRFNASQLNFLKQHAARLTAAGCRTTRVQLVRSAVNDMMNNVALELERGSKDDNKTD